MYLLAAIARSVLFLTNSTFASPASTPEDNRNSETSSPKVTQKNKKSQTAHAETDKLSASINELSTAIRDARTNESDKYEQEKVEIERKSLEADEKTADETEKLARYTDNIAGLTILIVVIGAPATLFVCGSTELDEASH